MYQWYIVHKRWLVYIAALIYWAGRELSSARWQLQGIKQKLITLKSHWLNYNSLVADYNSGHRCITHPRIYTDQSVILVYPEQKISSKAEATAKVFSNQSACLFGLTCLLIWTVLIERNKMSKWKSVQKLGKRFLKFANGDGKFNTVGS